MQKRLDALQKKPKHVRDRYAFFGAALVTLCLLGIWVTTVPVKLAKLTVEETAIVVAPEESIVAPVEMPKAPGRYAHLQAAVVTAYASLSAKVSTLLKDEASVPPAPTSTPMVWTERLEANESWDMPENAPPILIATSSSAGTGTSTVRATTTTPVVQ